MCLEDEETYGHGAVGLGEHLFAVLGIDVAAVEEFVEGDEVAERLAHLLSFDGDHVVVHPIVARAVTCDGGLLSYLAFVVGEHKVHSATVDVEHLLGSLCSRGSSNA